jgi:hypothetical protein
MLRTRPYLSWSQYSLWKSSKLSYYKIYGLNEKQQANKYFNKGNELGEALEHGETFSHDTELDNILKLVPKLDIMEDKGEVQLSNGEKILWFADSATVDNSLFLEYKTGKLPWTQERVDGHDQLLFYALGYYIRNGRVAEAIPHSKLIWVETEETDEGIKYTGRVTEFDRSFTEEEVLQFEQDLIKAIAEIEMWEYTEMEVEDDFIDRYNSLIKQKNDIDEEISIMKLEIQTKMEMEGVDYAKGLHGRFGYTTRKKWTYSDQLTNVAADFTKKVAAARKQEQKDGTATFTESKSLTYKVINN